MNSVRAWIRRSPANRALIAVVAFLLVLAAWLLASYTWTREGRSVTPVRAALRDRLDLNARLPSDARPTGYMYRDVQIYVSPSDQDEAIYVVGRAGTERWPRSDPMTLCV